MTVTGTNVQPNATFAGAESPGTTVTLECWQLQRRRSAVTGYTKTIGANCSGTIANGETKTCTITNDDQPATLTVIKHVINDNGGTQVAGGLHADRERHQRPADATFPGAESPGTTVTLNAGSYSVMKRPSAATRRPSAPTVPARSPTARPRPARSRMTTSRRQLTVIKHVINDNGGTQGRRGLYDDGERHQRPARRHVPGAESPGTTVTLERGQLQRRRSGRQWLREDALGADCSARSPTARPRPARSRTTTSRRTLTVIKHVINDNGGTKIAGDFTMTVTGTNVQPSATFPGAESPGTTVTLDAGGYSVDETGRQRLHEDARRRLLRHDRQRRDEDLHDHERRPAGDADGHQARDQQQRRHEGRGGLLADSDGTERPAERHVPRRRVTGNRR